MNNNFYEEYSDNQPDKKQRAYASDLVNASTVTLIKVFAYMFLGVLLTFITGIGCQKILMKALSNGNANVLTGFLVVMVISLVAELIMSYTITKNASKEQSSKKAAIQFVVYSILTGISFSILFSILDSGVLFQVFASVSLYFLLLAGISLLFKSKLQKLSSFAAVGLVTLLITTIFVGIYSAFFYTGTLSKFLYFGISVLGLIVFSVLTISDVKKVQYMINSTSNQKGVAIMGAFTLYLDFINILVYVIRIVAAISGQKSRK